MIWTRAILFSIILAGTIPALAGDVRSAELEAKIISGINTKALLMYTKYSGVECKKEIVSRQYDYRDNSYIGSYSVLFNRKEFYYKKPENKIITYIRNGKREPAWKYHFPAGMPPHHPFAPDTDKHYTIKLVGKKRINNVFCWELDVIPKKKTRRHMKGKIYFTCSSLDLFFLKATFAKYPIGVKGLEIEIYFKKLDDACVASHGTYTFMMNLPFIYPHTKFVQEFLYSENRLIMTKKVKKVTTAAAAAVSAP